MNTVEELDRKLHELDVRLRSGTLSRTDYRKVRRKAIDALEDPQTTVPHAVDASQDETVETATPTRPLPAAPVSPPTRGDAGRPRMMWIFAGVGALAALIVTALLLSGSDEPGPPPVPFAGVTDGPATAAGAPAPGRDSPQGMADRLMKSEWTDADIAAFLSRWNALAPQARGVARDDAGLWLLRGETDRRLNEAIDAVALDPTPEAQARVARVSALQAALRPE